MSDAGTPQDPCERIPNHASTRTAWKEHRVRLLRNELSAARAAWLATALLACSERSESALEQPPSSTASAAASAAASAKATFADGPVPTMPEISNSHTAELGGLASAAPHASGTGAGLRYKPIIAQAVADELEGKMSAEDLSRTFEDNANKLNVCLKTDTTISVKLKILPSGRVAETSSSRSNPNDVRMRDCVMAAVQRITFPKLRGLEPAIVNIELSLKKT